MADFPSVAEPTTDAASLRDSVLALKQGYEILTGQRGDGTKAAVTAGNAPSSGLAAPSGFKSGNLATFGAYSTALQDSGVAISADGTFGSNSDTLSPTQKASKTYTDAAVAAAVAAAAFPSGTLMLFQQTAAPTGWTKQTTHNDKALRVVSGTAASGGTNSFSTVMAQTSVGATALSISQIPAHTHSVGLDPSGTFGSGTAAGGSSATASTSTGSQGSGATHTHTITMAIQYVDIIIASKN